MTIEEATDLALMDMSVLMEIGVPWDVDMTDEVVRARCLPVIQRAMQREITRPLAIYEQLRHR